MHCQGGARSAAAASLLRADCRRLPFTAGAFDSVSAVWLLHLLDDAAPVVAEAARRWLAATS